MRLKARNTVMFLLGMTAFVAAVASHVFFAPFRAMRFRTRYTVPFLLCAMALVAVVCSHVFQRELQWHTFSEAALKDALGQGKTVVVLFDEPQLFFYSPTWFIRENASLSRQLSRGGIVCMFAHLSDDHARQFAREQLGLQEYDWPNTVVFSQSGTSIIGRRIDDVDGYESHLLNAIATAQPTQAK